MLVDADLADGGVRLAVKRARAKWPRARSILLVSDSQQKAEAEAARTDAVLLQGFPVGSLVATIVRVLLHPMADTSKTTHAAYSRMEPPTQPSEMSSMLAGFGRAGSARQRWTPGQHCQSSSSGG